MAVTWVKVLLDGDAATLSTSAPVDVTKSTGAPGTASAASRQDHKHDITTAVVGSIVPDSTAAEGTATSLSRSDHVHGFVNVTPTAAVDGGAAAEGTSSGISARADHKHALGPLAATLNFAGYQGANLVFENSATDPATPVLGKVYFRTGDLHPYVCTAIA